MTRASACICAPCQITVCPACGKSRYQTAAVWTDRRPTMDGWYAHRFMVAGSDEWSLPEMVLVYPEFLRDASKRIREQWSDRPYPMPSKEEA